MTTDKTRENRARIQARKAGYIVFKSRSRTDDEQRGRYVLVGDSAGNRYGGYQSQAVWGAFDRGETFSLDELEGEIAALL